MHRNKQYPSCSADLQQEFYAFQRLQVQRNRRSFGNSHWYGKKSYFHSAKKINGLTGDNEFSSAAIRKFCEDNNIRLDTSVAKEEHISNGNKLGIIDRLEL